MLGFSSVASRRNCCTARCCSIWYLLFIATLSFFLAEKSTVGLLWAASLRVATFYELPGKVTPLWTRCRVMQSILCTTWRTSNFSPIGSSATDLPRRFEYDGVL